MRHATTWFVLLISSAAFGTQPDRSVFGVIIGEEFSVPECQRDAGGGYNLFKSRTAICALTGKATNKAWGTKQIDIWLPDDFVPHYWKNPFSAELKDGRVASVGIATSGYAVQEAALKDLTRKYGRPSKLSKAVLQNAFGARFERYVAEWTFQDFSVSFRGIDADDIDWGSIEVSTPAYRRLIREYESKKGGPKL